MEIERGWKTEIERWEEEMEVLLMVDSKDSHDRNGWSRAQDGVRALNTIRFLRMPKLLFPN